MTKNRQAPQGHHGTDATPDRGRRFGTKVQETPMSGRPVREMKHDRGPADAANNGRHIRPDNTSKSMSRGGRVIGEALRGTRDMHIGGGCEDPGKRSLDQHARDVERGGKRG